MVGWIDRESSRSRAQGGRDGASERTEAARWRGGRATGRASGDRARAGRAARIVGLMRPPNPSALRLTTRARTAEPPAPPFGLRVWNPDATATAILLDATDADLNDVAAVSAQIPPATSLAPATPLVALGATAAAMGV